MAKLKLLKYPKAPNRNASIAAKENYILRCKDIDAKNRAKISAHKHSLTLDKKISGLLKVTHEGAHTNVYYLNKRLKKKLSAPKKRKKGRGKRKK